MRRKTSVGLMTKRMIFTLLFLLSLTEAHSGMIEMSDIKMEGEPGERIVTLRFTEAVNYRSFVLENPPRMVLDIPGVTFKEPRTIEVRNEMIETISYRQHQPDTIRIVVDLAQPAESRVRKVGRELRLYLSLPREMRARLRAEEEARQLFIRSLKRETELKAREVATEKERALEIAHREAREREEQLETYLSRGERHFRAQRFDEAMRKFEAALVLDPGSEKAQDYLILTKEAQEIRRQEEERKQRIAGYLNQGKEYYLQGRYTEAIFQGERALAFSPDNRKAEDLIMQSRRGSLRKDERRAREKRELVEARRMLDVTQATFIDDPGLRRDRDILDLGIIEDDPEKAVDTLRRRAEEIMLEVDFRATDIREVLLHLSKLSGLAIIVDERALRRLLDPDITIFTPTPIPLTDILGIILRVKGLGYAIREHYIWVAEEGAGLLGTPVRRTHRLKHIRLPRRIEADRAAGDRDRDRDRGGRR